MSGWCSSCNQEASDGIYICSECEEFENEQIAKRIDLLTKAYKGMKQYKMLIEGKTVHKGITLDYINQWIKDYEES